MPEVRPNPATALDRNGLLLLLLIVGIGVALRVFSLNQSLWLDELHTSWVVQDGVDLVARARLGNNSPVYFYIVRLLTVLFGESEWTVRLPSLIAGCLLIPGTFLLCREWKCSVFAALLAAALVAIDQHAHFFATEARTYALVQLFGLIHLSLFCRLLTCDDRVSTWIWWVLCGAFLFHLHCTAALVILSEVIGYVVLRWLRRPMKVQFTYLIAGFAAIGLGMLSGYALFELLVARRGNWSHFVPITHQPIKMLTLFPLWMYLLVPNLGGLILVLAKWGLGNVGKVDPNYLAEAEHRPVPSFMVPLVLAGCWLLVPIVSTWLLTELDWVRLFWRRYLIASSVALAPLTALSITMWTADRSRRASLLAILIFLIAAVCLPPRLAPRKEDWRDAVLAIKESATSKPVVLYSGLIETDGWFNTSDETQQSYCEFPLRGIYSVSDERSVIILPRSLTRLTKLELPEGADEAWLLSRGKRDTVEAFVLKQLNSHAGQGSWSAEQASQFGRMVLISLRRK